METLKIFINTRIVNIVQTVELRDSVAPFEAGCQLGRCNQCLPMKKGSSIGLKYAEEGYRYCERSEAPGWWKVIQTQSTDV